MTIRSFRPGDEDAVIALWLASTIPGQPFIAEAQWRAEEREVRDELLPIAETWVVEEEGTIVAFMSILDDMIGGLFTHPHHQGKGHGRSLVEHAARRRPVLLVEVFEVNHDAVRFYRHRGFVDHERAIHEGSGLVMLILRMENPDAGSAPAS